MIEVAEAEAVVIAMTEIIKGITSRRPWSPMSASKVVEETTEEIKRRINIISKSPNRSTNARSQQFTLKDSSKTK